MEKYRLKNELYWKFVNNQITVYSTNSNLIKEILVEDPESLFNFLYFLKEARSDIEIKEYPILDQIQKNSVMEFLKQKNYIHIETDTASSNDSRFNRFVSSFPEMNFELSQEKLSNTNVLILGLGTAGSYQIELLRKIGIKKFTLIDNDIVEENNLEAQNYFKSDIGKKKTEVLLKRYSMEDLDITIHNKFIKTYSELRQTIDLSSIDYIINCADDSTLCMDIIENIFKDHKEICLFINGYTVLQQCSIKVTCENHLSIHTDLMNRFLIEDSNKSISVNAGSIFNAFFLTFSIGKMILDDLFGLSNSSYAFSDYYSNDFYIGTQFDYSYYKQYQKKKLSLLKHINKFPQNKNDNRWINAINEQNLYNNNALITPSPIKYGFKEQDKKILQHMLDHKQLFKKYDPVPFSDIEGLLYEFIKDNFSKEIFERLVNLRPKFQIKNEPFLLEKSFTEKLSNTDLLLYSVNNSNESQHTNSIIHEMLHIVYFLLTQSNNSIHHEKFVREQHTKFLLKNISINSIKELSKNYLNDLYNSFIGMSLVVEYEFHTIKDTVDDFFKKNPDTRKNSKEFVELLNLYIDPYNPLSKYKYISALNDSYDSIISLEKQLN